MDNCLCWLIGAFAARDADADRDIDLGNAGRNYEPGLFDGQSDLLSTKKRLLHGRLGDQDRKLLTTETGDDIVFAYYHLKNRSSSDQYLITGQVAICIVDVSEEIEIDHDDREGPIKTVGTLQFAGQLLHKIPVVEQSGHPIGFRLSLRGGDPQGPVDQI